MLTCSICIKELSRDFFKIFLNVPCKFLKHNNLLWKYLNKHSIRLLNKYDGLCALHKSQLYEYNMYLLDASIMNITTCNFSNSYHSCRRAYNFFVQFAASQVNLKLNLESFYDFFVIKTYFPKPCTKKIVKPRYMNIP